MTRSRTGNRRAITRDGVPCPAVRFVPAMLVAALSLAGAAAALAAPTPPLGHDGRWITDGAGRVVILHGANMVYKVGSYEPADAGFGADDAEFLARHGFNTVRLGVIYKGVEPAPRDYRADYIESIAQTEQILAERGIFSLVDFHQDMYNERFQGEGFPDWAVDDDGLPNEPGFGFPGNYLLMPALWRAYDHFWANDVIRGRGLQDAYAQAWRRVAARFADAPYVMGYDLFNEPWPGSIWESCANPLGCPAVDTGPLASMTRKAHSAIRQVDDTHTVWAEPNVIFNNGADSSLPRIGANVGFSFHVYCLTAAEIPPLVAAAGEPDCQAFDSVVFDNADKQARETGQALLLSEFGATNDVVTLKRVIDLADEHMTSWQYWHYCECGDPTTTGTGQQGIVYDANEAPSGANVNHRKLALLARPYPQAVAGTPEGYRFNRSSRVFRLEYSTRTPAGRILPAEVLTEVFLPELHYPRGYRVSVQGADVVSAPDARVLELRRELGADEVGVAVWPAPAT